MPVSPPLSTTESGTATLVRPTNTLEFNGADFTVTGSGDKATISIDSTGAGAALTDTHIGFGNASNLLTGSANFTFTEESGVNGPTVAIAGGKPIFTMSDDDEGSTYLTKFVKSGHNFIMYQNSGSDVEFMRFGSSAVIINEGGVAGVDFKVESADEGAMFKLDAGQNNIGIATLPSSDVERLHIKGTGGSSGGMVRLESTETGTTDGPILDLYRNRTGAASSYLGNIRFIGKDDGDNVLNFCQVRGYMSDDDAGSADSLLQFKGLRNSAEISVMDMYSYRVTINPSKRSDVDFRVSTTGVTDMLMVDASLNSVGIGANPVSAGATFQVPDNTISSYCNVNAVRSDSVATQTMVNNDCQGQMWVNNSATAWTLDLPESTVKGMWFKFVSTNGDMTVDPNPSGGTSNTINGGTGAVSRNTNNEIYTVICIAANTWIISNPA